MKVIFVLAVLFSSLNAFAMLGVDECQDVNGHPVQIQTNFNLKQAAEGTIINGLPVILVHPGMMSQYPMDVQRFILAHECSHHRQGHVVSMVYRGTLPITVEFDADCMGVRTLRDLGILSSQSLENIQAFLRTLMADATHPAGSYRAQYAAQCGSY